MLTNAPKGAQLLDRFRPGWAERIDQERFDIHSVTKCALALEFGDYAEGLRQLLVATRHDVNHDRPLNWHQWSEAHGFVNNGHPPALLQSEWMELIAQRLPGGAN